jgi:hypothetical protein
MPMRHPLLLGAVLVVMIWLAAGHDQWRHAYVFKGQKQDYYNLLVDGMLEGHLHLKAVPHPDLATRDPEVLSRTPYLLDASLYDGRYYLYFGVVPAVLLFLPYAALTGHDLPMNAAVLTMVYLGFLLQYGVLVKARRRYFPTLPFSLETLAALLLAFAAVTPILLKGSGMYEIAIAGGYFCLSLVWWAVFQAIERPGRSGRWWVVASLAAGLAVGCRPTLGVVLPLLGGFAAWIGWRERRNAAGWLRLGGAVVIPAGVVGLVLMLYNHARFDDPFEFGFRHTLSALILDGFPLAKAAFVGPNLRWYYGLPPALSPHFPWVEPLHAYFRPDDYYGYESIYGQALMLWLGVLTGVGALVGWRRRTALAPLLAGFLALLVAAFIALLLGLSVFGFRADRYMVDMQGTLALLVAVGGGAVAAGLGRSAIGRGWRLVWGAGAGLAVLFNLLVALDHIHHFEYVRPKVFKPLAYVGNYPSYLAHRLGLLTYGSVRFTAQFDAEREELPRPLFATGHSRETDVWYVRSVGEGEFEVSLVHQNFTPLVKRVQLEPGMHEVEIKMGSLYPPRWHPYFRGWSLDSIEAVKTTGVMRINGQEVFTTRQPFYDASPWRVWLGSSPIDSDRRWAGPLGPLERPTGRSAHQPEPIPVSGVWRVVFEVRPGLLNVAMPVLSSGTAGAGNLLAVTRLNEEAVEFKLDQWGGTLTRSDPIPFPPGLRQVDLWVGTQAATRPWALSEEERARLEELKDQFEVWVDGSLVWTTPILVNQNSYQNVGLGTNAQGFSTSISMFNGEFRIVDLSPEQTEAWVKNRLQAPVEP